MEIKVLQVSVSRDKDAAEVDEGVEEVRGIVANRKHFN